MAKPLLLFCYFPSSVFVDLAWRLPTPFSFPFAICLSLTTIGSTDSNFAPLRLSWPAFFSAPRFLHFPWLVGRPPTLVPFPRGFLRQISNQQSFGTFTPFLRRPFVFFCSSTVLAAGGFGVCFFFFCVFPPPPDCAGRRKPPSFSRCIFFLPFSAQPIFSLSRPGVRFQSHSPPFSCDRIAIIFFLFGYPRTDCH